ncbi:unnamed protein product [Acanthocheilonema viteae]|uniref:DM domain-containing protein n=1 Tax=Acanthocheilonema viteae TaxID=6277 RepID=A0A498SVY2_ACAVI|nr:unnamed protein product [Acanthocheilonema viteae]
MSKEKNCHRYFAVSKKMPKDVKRHCGMCRQHGMLVETRGHHCKRKNCNCLRCLLIRQRRKIMSTQIRIRRAQDKIFQRTSELTQATITPQNYFDKNDTTTYHLRNATKTNTITQNQCYICQKCKNHGVLVWKKEHKRHCLYANCKCDQCELIEKRRKLDQILKASKFKSNEHEKERQKHVPISVNSISDSNMLPIVNFDNQLSRQTYDQDIAELLIPQLESSSYTLLKTTPQTNISIVTFDESKKSDTAPPNNLVYPIPLRPQSFLLPMPVLREKPNVSNEGNDYDEDESIRDSEKIRKKKEGRGRILSKLRNIGRRVKSRIRREQSVSSQSTEYDFGRDEDNKSEGIKIEQAESEYTETPMQTTDAVSSDQELEYEITHSTDGSSDSIASRRHRIVVSGDKINQEMTKVEDVKEDDDPNVLQLFTVSFNIY